MVDCFNLVVDIKEVMLYGLSDNPGYDTYLQSRTKGYIPSSGEGIALSDDRGNIVKLVNRAEFSNANRDPDIIKGFEHESLGENVVYDSSDKCYNDNMEKLYEELNKRHLLLIQGYDYIPDLDEDFRYVDSAVTKEFKGSGKVDMRGHEVEGPVDLANLFSIFRDRRYETFRVVFVKDNKIVGTENITSKLLGSSVLYKYYKNSTEDQSMAHTFVDLKTKYDRLDSDGYYLFHNHPSGNNKLSNKDISATKLFNNRLPGFKGHIIEGSDMFTIIDGDGNINEFPLKDKKEYNSLGTIKGAQSIANMASHYAFDKNVSVVFYVNARLEVMAVQEVDNYEFKEQSVANYFSKQKKENGAHYLFLVTKDPELFEDMSEQVLLGLFKDIIVVNDDNTILSYNLLGKLPNDKYKEIVKSYKEDYDPNNVVNTVSNTDKDPSVIATKQYHKMKTKKLKPGQMIVSPISENLQPFELEKEKSRIRDVLDIMKDVEYGFISQKDGKRITDRDWIHNNDLADLYKVNTNPIDTIRNKLGICQDQSIAIKYLMNKFHPEDEVIIYTLIKSPKGHCVPCYCHNGKWYYIENAWDKEKGLHGYFDSKDELEKYLEFVYQENHENDTPIDSNVKVSEYQINEKIAKKGSQWQVQSEKGRNMGTYDTKGEAEKRLQQVHYFKHKNEEYNINIEDLTSFGGMDD